MINPNPLRSQPKEVDLDSLGSFGELLCHLHDHQYVRAMLCLYGAGNLTGSTAALLMVAHELNRIATALEKAQTP